VVVVVPKEREKKKGKREGKREENVHLNKRNALEKKEKRNELKRA